MSTTVMARVLRAACLVVLVLGAGGLGVPAPAAAHPHAWIDLETRLSLAAPGTLQAIEQTWLFDEYYTAFVANDFAKDPESRGLTGEAMLLELASANLARLRAYDYFTEVRTDATRVETDTVTGFETGMRGHRIWLRFTLPLTTPVPLAAGPVRIRIFDPSYWIEMLHPNAAAVRIDGPGADACRVRIVPAQPTMEQIFLAGAIDRDAEAPDNLGSLFAETLTLTCR